MHQTVSIKLPIYFPKILAQIPFPGAFPKIMKIQKLGKGVGVIELRNSLNNNPDPACEQLCEFALMDKIFIYFRQIIVRSLLNRG